MTRIKICGLTNRDDALLAAELGADALGFVFAPNSKRKADPAVAARIIEELPPFVTSVGVFQNQPLYEVQEIFRGCSLSVAQLHGDEDQIYLESLGLNTLKCFSLASKEDLKKIESFGLMLNAFLLDASVGGETGGTGKTFNWDWAVEAKTYGKVILAGGLDPDNVAEAISKVKPWGVDGASGTEKAPGRKDPELVRQFIQGVRRADLRTNQY